MATLGRRESEGRGQRTHDTLLCESRLPHPQPAAAPPSRAGCPSIHSTRPFGTSCQPTRTHQPPARRARLLLVVCALVWCSASVCLVSGTVPPLLAQSRQATNLIAVTSSTCTVLIQRAAEVYKIIRPEIDIVTMEPASTTKLTSTQVGENLMRAGAGDMSFTSYAPTAADAVVSPDLGYFPFFAQPFSAIYNLPGMTTLTLNRAILAKIWVGNITRWDHPAIAALNPRLSMPSVAITVVLQQDPFTFIKEFTRTSTAINSQFASLVGFTSFPKWPVQNYAAYAYVTEVYGAASYVNDHPYSLGLSMTSFAVKMGVPSAAMINSAGERVVADFDSTRRAFQEMAVTASRNGTGGIAHGWTGVLTNSPGQSAWPLTIFVGLTMSRTYARQSCRARSETVKFIRWMMESEVATANLGYQELSVFVTNDIDVQLGISTFLDTLICEDARVNTGDVRNLVIGGFDLSSAGDVLPRELLMMSYGGLVVSSIVDESAALDSVGEPDRDQDLPDLAWVLPRTFEWRGGLQAIDPATGLFSQARTDRINANLMYLPIGVFGLAVRYTLPAEVLVALHPPMVTTHGQTVKKAIGLPMVADIEIIASIFAGDITRWTDPRLVLLNPLVASAFNATGADDAITLVLFGDFGDPTDEDSVQHESVTEMFLSLLRGTVAFQQRASSVNRTWPTAGIPDWTPVTGRTDVAVRYVSVDTEDQFEEMLISVPGAIGIVVPTPLTPAEGVFDLNRPVDATASVVPINTPSAGGVISTSPRGERVSRVGLSVANLRSCLSYAADAWVERNPTFGPEVSTDPFDAGVAQERAAVLNQFQQLGDGLLFSTEERYASCYPLAFMMTLVVARDSNGQPDDTLPGNSVAFFCQRGTKIANLAGYLLQDWNSWGRSGAASAASVPTLSQQVQWRMDMLTCNGDPLFWTRSTLWHVPSWISTLAIALTIAGLILVVIVFFVLAKYRNYALIRSAKLPFQVAICIGVVFLLCSMILLTNDTPSSATCSSLIWLITLGYSFAITAPCVKAWFAWRGHRASKRNQLTRPSYRRLLQVVTVGAACLDWILLGVAQAKGGMLQSIRITQNESGIDTVYMTCSVPDAVLPEAALLFGIKIVLLIGGSVSAFLVRNRASAYNEMAHLARSIYNANLSIVLIVPILVLVGGRVGSSTMLLEVVLLAWLSFSILIFIFAPKIYSLLTDHLERRAFEASNANSAAYSSAGTFSRRSVYSTTAGGMTAAGTSYAADIFAMPDLELFSLKQLERYMTSLETQLQLAKAKRLAEFGSPWVAETEGDIIAKRAAEKEEAIRQSAPVVAPDANRPVAAAAAVTALGNKLRNHIATTNGGTGGAAAIPPKAPTAATAAVGAPRRRPSALQSHRRDLSNGMVGPADSSANLWVGNEIPQIGVELVLQAQSLAEPNSAPPTHPGAARKDSLNVTRAPSRTNSPSTTPLVGQADAIGAHSLNSTPTGPGPVVAGSRAPLRVGPNLPKPSSTGAVGSPAGAPMGGQLESNAADDK